MTSIRIVTSCLVYLGALAFTGSYFGQGSSDTQLGNFLCNGTEDKLLKCIHSITSCLHSNEAGVRCRGIYNTNLSSNFNFPM